MCFKREEVISSLNGGWSLKLVHKFMFIGSSVSSTESEVDMRLTKVESAVDRLSIIQNSDQSDKIKRDFFQVTVMSVLLYGWTTWKLTKRKEKKLDRNCTKMLRAILKKSWKQHSTKHQQYSHLPPISKTIQIRRHAAQVTFFYGPLHMDVPVLADQQELFHICSLQTQDIVGKVCRE